MKIDQNSPPTRPIQRWFPALACLLVVTALASAADAGVIVFGQDGMGANSAFGTLSSDAASPAPFGLLDPNDQDDPASAREASARKAHHDSGSTGTGSSGSSGHSNGPACSTIGGSSGPDVRVSRIAADRFVFIPPAPAFDFLDPPRDSL
jgi:hypothetical protein